MFNGFRCLGSSALQLAYVARGCIDGYQVDDLKLWDIAAGALLIREALPSYIKLMASISIL